MSRAAVLHLISALTLAGACVETQRPSTAMHHVSASQLMLEPDKYDGKFVAAIGFMRVSPQYLYLDMNPQPDLSSKVVYVRLRYTNEEASKSWIQTAECKESLVRVYGQFHRWSPDEAWIDHVYRITTAAHRAPGPEDQPCWTNSDFEPK